MTEKVLRSIVTTRLRRKADTAFDAYDGKVTYGLACRCGHRGIVRMDPDEALDRTFKCRRCGRTQTREKMAT